MPWPQPSTRLVRVAAAAFGVAVVAVFWHLVAAQVPRTFWDTSAYVEMAQRPFSAWHFFYPKPIAVPTLYRLIGTAPAAVARGQAVLAVVSWAILAGVLVAALRRRRARIAAVVVVGLFLLDPFRIGFCGAVLSESITDSLMALVFAGALALVAWPAARRPLAVALAAVTCAWILSRDTDSIVALAAVALCAAIWRRTLWRRWWELGALAAVALCAAFSLWSTNVTPPPTGLTFQKDWPSDALARRFYSILNDVYDRMLPDPDARALLVARGMPLVDELRAKNKRADVLYDLHDRPAATWIATRGEATYTAWLVRHPFARLAEVAGDPHRVLGAYVRELRWYMPHGWSGTGWWYRLRHLVETPFVLALLALAWAAALWRRRSPLVLLATVAIASALLGCLAAYYGDSSELTRHCYGSGQQLAFALYLAAFAWLDRDGRASPESAGPAAPDPR